MVDIRTTISFSTYKAVIDNILENIFEDELFHAEKVGISKRLAIMQAFAPDFNIPDDTDELWNALYSEEADDIFEKIADNKQYRELEMAIDTAIEKWDEVNTKIKQLLKYSIPMIPDYLSGWIINVSDRTIISIILGTAMNGIYTVSCKFSNILNSIFSIVNMSWQETASIHIKDNDRDNFFSSMMNNMVKIFSTIGIMMLVCIPLAFNIIIGKSY